MTPQEVAKQFVAAINAHDVEHLATLMTSDHRFIDSLGAVVEGRDSTREGWKLYFAMVPDYHLEVRDPRGRGEWLLLVERYQATKLGMEHSRGASCCGSEWSNCGVASVRRQ